MSNLGLLLNQYPLSSTRYLPSTQYMARSPLPSPPLTSTPTFHPYESQQPQIMSNMLPHPLPPLPPHPTQPSTIAPPPIQTASDIENAEKVKKKHVCPTCQRPFTTSGHLARHMRVHTGERNHKCPFPGCETRCSRQDNLQQHYRIHLSPRSRRNSNAATRAAIAKAMEQQAAAQASGQSPPPNHSPSTTLTLPHHHHSHPQTRHHPHRGPPSPIENALGLDSTNSYPSSARSAVSLSLPSSAPHHPSSAPPRYSNGFGYESPRNGPSLPPQNPSASYPSPYSTGPGHHPLPPTSNANVIRGSVSYDRVGGNGGSAFPSPQSPTGAYPSPDEGGHHPGHPGPHHNGYSNSAPYPNGGNGHHSSNGYNHSSYAPQSQGGYYAPPPSHHQHHQQPRVSPPHSAPQSYANSPTNTHAHPMHQQPGSAQGAGTISPPPILPPIQPHHSSHQTWRHAQPSTYAHPPAYANGHSHSQASSSDSEHDSRDGHGHGPQGWNGSSSVKQQAVANGSY